VAVKASEYFTIEAVGSRAPWRPLHQGRLAVMLLLAAITLWPDADPRRAEFGLYLQARSFADLSLAIRRPSTAQTLPPGLTTHDGHYYLHSAPGAAFTLVPFIWFGRILDGVTGGILGAQEAGGWNVRTAEYAAVYAAGPVFLAAILFLVIRLGGKLAVSPSASIRASQLLFFAAPLWHESTRPGAALPSTMLLLAATALAFAARDRARGAGLAWAGMLAGAALMVRPTDLILVLVLLAYVFGATPSPWSAARRFAVPLMVAVGVLIAVDGAMGGAALQRDPQSTFATPLGEGLLGLILGAVGPVANGAQCSAAVLPSLATSWNRLRGVLLLMPVIVFGVPGLVRLSRQGKRDEAAVIGGSLVLLLLLFARYSGWCGAAGIPLPSPFLAEAMPAWCLAIAAWSERASRSWRSWFFIAACWSAANQALVVFSSYATMLAGADGRSPQVWEIGALLVVSALFAWIGEGVWRSYTDAREGRAPA
jgi:hypothetical protein